jgi:propanol-preferring alcohol dehydrogenase
MRCWVVSGQPGGIGRVVADERPRPEPAADEVVVRVHCCGVCRTDLHLADHELVPQRPRTVPGHEIVGDVVERGDRASRFSLGDRVGIAWLRRTCGRCAACRRGRENLCRASEYTGWTADGGFAEYAVVPEAYAYELPTAYDDVAASILLCSGIIGYRALRRAALPPGGRLGIYGFGASAHLTAQLPVAQGAEVHVLTRDEAARDLASDLGAASVGPADGRPPVPLDSAILFAPVGELVPHALAALEQGGTLAVAGIHLSDIPRLVYAEHLFRERTLTSVTSNTRADGEEFLRLAAALPFDVHGTVYPFDQVDRALDDLAPGRFSAAAAVRVS